MKGKWITICAVVSAILSFAFSEVSSPHYLGLVGIALTLGVFSILACATLLLTSSSKGKWAILVVLLPVLVFTIDNVGRLMSILGVGGFRILI